MTRPEKIPAQAGFEPETFRSRGERLTSRPTRRFSAYGPRAHRQTQQKRRDNAPDKKEKRKRERERASDRRRIQFISKREGRGGRWGRETETETYRQTDKETDRETERGGGDRQRDRQTNRERERQADRQTGRQTDRQRESCWCFTSS